MRIDHLFPWGRIARSLETGPIIINEVVDGISDAEADFRPDPERFTIREIIPHLAGWEPIAFDYLRRTCDEEVPYLEDRDHTAHIATPGLDPRDIVGQCRCFVERRAKTVAFLLERSAVDWDRQALRSQFGPTTLDAQAVMLLMHDMYHIRQIVDWKRLFIGQ